MKNWFRFTLFAAALTNLLGSILFLPSAGPFRAALALPDAHGLYFALLAFWILLFGLFFGYFALKKQADRSLILLSMLAKGFFALVLLYLGIRQEIPFLTALAGLPDLGFAVLFGIWLLQSRD